MLSCSEVSRLILPHFTDIYCLCPAVKCSDLSSLTLQMFVSCCPAVKCPDLSSLPLWIFIALVTFLNDICFLLSCSEVSRPIFPHFHQMGRPEAGNSEGNQSHLVESGADAETQYGRLGVLQSQTSEWQLPLLHRCVLQVDREWRVFTLPSLLGKHEGSPVWPRIQWDSYKVKRMDDFRGHCICLALLQSIKFSSILILFVTLSALQLIMLGSYVHNVVLIGEVHFHWKHAW